MKGVFVVLMLALVLVATPTFGQSDKPDPFHTMEGYVTGVYPGGFTKSSFNPGVQARVNLSDRISFEAGFMPNTELSSSTRHLALVEVRDGECILGCTYRELVGQDETAVLSAKFVSSSVLINLLTSGRVRPFIGAGPGVFMETKTTSVFNLHGLEEYEELYGFPLDYDTYYRGKTVKTNMVVGVATAGVKFAVAPHIVVSPSFSQIVGKGIKFKTFTIGVGVNF